jgi:hypothetical protein
MFTARLEADFKAIALLGGLAMSEFKDLAQRKRRFRHLRLPRPIAAPGDRSSLSPGERPSAAEGLDPGPSPA